MKRPWIWSWSRIEAHRRCPLLFKYRYLDRIQVPKRPATRALFMGILGHVALENYLTGGNTRTVRKALLGAEIYDPQYVEPVLSLLAQNRVTLKSFRGVIRSAEARGVEEWWNATETWTPCAKNSPTIWATARVDLWWQPKGLDEWSIVDHKFGSSRFVNKDQLRFYCCIAPAPPKTVFRVQHYFVAENKVTDWERIEPLMLEYFRDQFRTETTGILTKSEYLASPGKHCSWCDFASMCPEITKHDQRR